MRRQTVWGVLVLVVAGVAMGAGEKDPVVRPVARAQTEAMPHTGDAADDPAIWVHPTDVEKSLILGTDKQGGLHSFGLDGKRKQVVNAESLPNNVDVLYGLQWGEGHKDVAVASCRGKGSMGVKVWTIDAATGELKDVTAGGAIAVFGGKEPYGICAYKSAKTGKAYFFVNHKSGAVEQYEMTAGDRATVAGKLVRSLKVGTIVEGCVADNELGVFYLAEEQKGIWKFPAEPDGGTTGKLIHKVGEHGLTGDVEGLTIYYAKEGKGYLIASSQGNDTFKVYERDGENAFVLTIDPAEAAGGGIDDVNDTDGIDVISAGLGKAWPKGMFIVQDGTNRGGNQNFKMYGWEDIAGAKLKVETGWGVRDKVKVQRPM